MKKFLYLLIITATFAFTSNSIGAAEAKLPPQMQVDLHNKTSRTVHFWVQHNEVQVAPYARHGLPVITYLREIFPTTVVIRDQNRPVTPVCQFPLSEEDFIQGCKFHNVNVEYTGRGCTKKVVCNPWG